MKQTFTPNFGAPARAGYCQEYVDNAGSAPTRRPTAKAAFEAELAAGRIRGSIDGPVDVWVVGFLAFTQGSYVYSGVRYYMKDLGHVFFMKHLGGGRYEIRDSEVASGQRGVYGSLAEIVAWFGAYKPSFIGWSTDCDGRNYAKEVQVEREKYDKGDRFNFNAKMLGGDKGLFNVIVNKDVSKPTIYELLDSDEFRAEQFVNRGDLSNWLGRDVTAAELDEFQIDPKTGIAKLGGGVTHKDATYRLLSTGRLAVPGAASKPGNSDAQQKLEKIKEIIG